MLRKVTAVLSALFCAVLIFHLTAAAQDAVPAARSGLTDASLPNGASRLSEASVPAQFNAALDKLIAGGGSDVKRGRTEVLAWENGIGKSNVPKTLRQLSDNLRTAGWEYEASPENGGLAVFSAVRSVPTKRALVGIYTYSDEVLVVAWTEMLPVKSPTGQTPAPNSAQRDDGPKSNPEPSGPASSAEVVTFNVERDAHFVNVAGSEIPPMPKFPVLQPKSGRVRGYVKDLAGNPLKGATLGIRASYLAGMYSGAQGETDANGYYEFVVPKGSAHFYNAGYQLEWGGGLAAVGLHPADGKLESFTTVDGAVENFVLLPYGITSRENVSQNPFVSSSYYGGSIYLSYYTVEAGDQGRSPGTIVEGTVIEITLTPEGRMLDGTAGKTYVIRQPIGFKGNLYIHNIPLGQYRVTAKTGGKPLRMKQNRKFNPLFGLMPGEALGEAKVLFIPDDAKASSATPNAGTWTSVDISLTMP